MLAFCIYAAIAVLAYGLLFGAAKASGNDDKATVRARRSESGDE